MTRSTGNPLTPAEALSRLADRCSMAEVCSHEAAQKLAQWGISADEARGIMHKLRQMKFIDDERYTRAFVRSKVNIARWGKLKIRRALSLKRLPAELIDAALDEEVDLQTYYENLAAALRSKARSMPEVLDAACRARLMRFAAARGYEPGLIMEMLPEEDYWRPDER